MQKKPQEQLFNHFAVIYKRMNSMNHWSFLIESYIGTGTNTITNPLLPPTRFQQKPSGTLRHIGEVVFSKMASGGYRFPEISDGKDRTKFKKQ